MNTPTAQSGPSDEAASALMNCWAAGPENEMDHLIDDADRELELPPEGHPLHKLGARLTELLDEDQWAACERLLLEGWAHDAIDRKTGANWRDDSSLQVWFPYTHEELARLRDTLQSRLDAAGDGAALQQAIEEAIAGEFVHVTTGGTLRLILKRAEEIRSAALGGESPGNEEERK